MIKEPDGGKESPKRHWIIILSTITVIALFIIIAIFTVFVHRAFVTLTSENAESEYRHGDLYYNSLNYRLQYLYDEITDSAENLKSTTDIIPYYYTEQEFSRVISYIKADRSDLFWFRFLISFN